MLPSEAVKHAEQDGLRVRVGCAREDRVAERGELALLVGVLNRAGCADNGIYEQRVVGQLRGVDAVKPAAEFLDGFREFL